MTLETQTTAGGETPQPVYREIKWANKTCAEWAPISTHHVRLTRKRLEEWGFPIICQQPERGGKFILVGSSPYVTGFTGAIRDLAGLDQSAVFAINSAHNLVLDSAIRLDGSVLFEGGPDNHVRKFRPHDAVTYYMASWCHPHQWEALKDFNKVLWHANSDFLGQRDEYFKFPFTVRPRLECDPWDAKYIRDYGIIGGGATTFTRAVNIGMYLGYRDFELFGFDSSFEKDGESHYVMSEIGAGLPTLDVVPTIKGKTGPTFWAKSFMARQAHEFLSMLSSPTNIWSKLKYRMRMHGPGMLPWMHRAYYPEMYGDA